MGINYINRENDEEIIKLIKSILDNGQMKVETFNESILVELMERRGTPILYDTSLRDTKKDLEEWMNHFLK